IVDPAGPDLGNCSGKAGDLGRALARDRYIAFQEVAAKVQEVARVTSVPILVDGDTGHTVLYEGSPALNSFATAGAAGIMIEDQTWPKSKTFEHPLDKFEGELGLSIPGCGHTAGKSVVSRSEAYARWRAAVDARNEGLDIWIMARTDSLILGYDEALARAKKAVEIGVDAVFVEALPDRETMARLRKDLDFPLFANIIEGGKTENLSAKELGEVGYCGVAYPWTLVAAKLRSIRETLEALKGSLTVGKPPTVLSYAEVCDGVGFNKYFELEERYQYEGRTNGANGHQWKK
ncbi:carboxyvinyl-carboxyphosphonate phosphorylmutase, partial [Colletotrichum kahawae]